MIKSILIATDGSPYGDTAADYALYLADKLNARLLGLHALDSRLLEGPLLADISGWVGAQPYADQMSQFRELMTEKGQAVLKALESRCAEKGVAIECELKTGHPSHVILHEEGRAELIIIAQKGEHAKWMGGMLGSNTERIVRRTAKPCLITPECFQPITKILAAYDGSGHAGEALREATELAIALKLDLVIITVDENGNEERANKISNDAKRLAADHGVEAEMVVKRGEDDNVILDTAREMDCDLIVAGSQGHGLIHEMILGSTTTQLVTHTSVPVLLVP